MTKRQCPICKTWFEPKQWQQKFCCPAHAHEGRHAQNKVRQKIYLARSEAKARKQKPNAKCPACGNLSWRKKYGKGMSYRHKSPLFLYASYLRIWKYAQALTLVVIMETALLAIIFYIWVVVR